MPAPVTDTEDRSGWLAALGGAANVRALTLRPDRVRVQVADVALVDPAALARHAPRGWREVAPGIVHALV